MSTNNDRIVDTLRRMPDIRSKTAIFVERDGIKATVNIGGTAVTLPFIGLYLPPRGHAVQLELRDGVLAVTGPASPLPGEGIITSVGTPPRAVVTAWGTAYTLRYKSSYTPVLNDLVAITWSADEGIIEGKLSAASSVVPPTTNPGGGGTQSYHPPPFTPIDSGTFRSGSWFTNDVYASASNDGAYFYGSKIKDTIPDGATITSAYIYISVRTINVNAAGQMKLHTNATKPGGAPSFTGSAIAVPAVSDWFVIPNAWIDFLKANDGGIGCDGGGYWIMRGTGSDGLAGALDVFYTA